MQVYCCCASSAFQVNYETVDKPEIEAWVRDVRRAARHHRAGQLRLHRGRGRDGVRHRVQPADALGDHDVPRPSRGWRGPTSTTPEAEPPLRPAPDSRPTYWLYHELWRLLTDPARARERWRVARARARTRCSTGTTRCRSCWCTTCRFPWLLLDEPAARPGMDPDRLQHRQARRAAAGTDVRVLHLVGLTDERVSSRTCRGSTRPTASRPPPTGRYELRTSPTSTPDGGWRFPGRSDRAAIAGGAGRVAGEALPRIDAARHRRRRAADVLPGRDDDLPRAASTCSACPTSATRRTSWRWRRTRPRPRRWSPPPGWPCPTVCTVTRGDAAEPRPARRRETGRRRQLRRRRAWCREPEELDGRGRGRLRALATGCWSSATSSSAARCGAES